MQDHTFALLIYYLPNVSVLGGRCQALALTGIVESYYVGFRECGMSTHMNK